MKNHYDVIIIGAGPAGLECARTLMNSDLKVLVLEKSKVIGTKICAGGVKDSEAIVDVPEELVKRFKRHISYLRGHKTILSLDQDQFKCFERIDFGQYLLKIISKAKNITIKNPVLVKKITKEEVETNQGSFTYTYLVGADGSNSIVRAFLGLSSKHCMGLYYNISPTSDELIAYYDPKTIKTGYIWEFPHKEVNNVGIYFDLKLLNPQKAKKYLQDYLKQQSYQYEETDFYGALINYDYQGHEFDNIFLCGDAGGFASRLHGGGMSNGMTSGRDIAKKILDKDYDYSGINNILDKKKQEARLLDMAEKLPAWALDILLFFILKLVKLPFIGKRINLM
jgi:flavin-dependent dehydrogenase